MDEPLSALDENLREEMRREIDNLQQMLGVTTIFVTHDQREALSMSDKIVVMKSGLKQQEGCPEDVYNLPANHFVADFLGHSNFYKGTVADAPNGFVKVKLETGDEFLSEHPGDWKQGQPIEVVIRAQKFLIVPEEEKEDVENVNSFIGEIKDRSYMGGEVSYFVTLDSGVEVHAISMVNQQALRIGTRVCVQVNPRHCGLLDGKEAE